MADLSQGIIELLEQLLGPALGKTCDIVGNKVEIEKKYKQINEHIQQTVEQESDALNRERLYEFLVNKYETLFFGKPNYNEDQYVDEMEERYGCVLQNDTKKLLLREIRELYDLIYQILSPQQRMLLQSNQENKTILIEIRQKLDEYKNERTISSSVSQNKMIPINREAIKERGDWQIFCDKWNGSLFKEDANARKLSEVFVKTNYSFIDIRKKENQIGKGRLQTAGTIINGYNINKVPSYNGGNSSAEYVIHHFDDLINECINIDDFLNKYIESDRKIALIFGLPGVGKSSIVAYMAGDYFKNEVESIFVLLSKIKYANNLLDSICDYLNIKAEELENKYLILDGLDEIANVPDAENMLINFIDTINRKYKRINVIITLRENYIDIRSASYIEYYAKCSIAQIEYFGKIQFVDFHKKFARCDMDINRLEILIKDREVFGIPLLLYIIYSLNLNVTTNADKYTLYQRIFAIDGGIYDKCNDGNGGYSEEADFTVEEKEGFHLISQIIAYYIYQQGNLEIEIQKVTEEILQVNCPERSKRCYLYNNYYEVNAQKIKFIHKSFYEFFLAEHIEIMLRNMCTEGISILKRYADLSNFLAKNKIDEEVFHHLRNKMNDVDYVIVDFFTDYVNDVCKNGGIFYVTENDNSILKSEANLFYNLMIITGVIATVTGMKIKVDYQEELWNELANIEQIGYLKSHLLDGIDFIDSFNNIIPCSILGIDRMKPSMIDTRHHLWMNTFFLNLIFQNSDLSDMYFLGSQMENCRFEGVDLRDGDFRYTHLDTIRFVNGSLQNSDFSKSELKEVIFRGVNLSGVKFDDCEFQGVTFDSENIVFIEEYLMEKYDSVSVYIIEKRETVSYTEYKQYYLKAY